MSAVADTLTAFFKQGRQTRQTPSGWLSGNAVCCHHNGHSPDTRERAGIVAGTDGGVTYHCFNCGFKASWQPSRQLSYKMKRLLVWLGAEDSVINKLALEVMRENDNSQLKNSTTYLPSFSPMPLPDDAVKITDITDWNKYNIRVLEFIAQRNLQTTDTDFYWSSSLAYRDRLIIPFYYQENIVGWTARSVVPDKKPKYLAETQPGYVYGLDQQHYNRKFAIVCEGQIDAVHVQGCALNGSSISDQQSMLLNTLNREIVIVPDRDTAGKKLIEQAIDREWSVSLPNWAPDINDISDAVARYGRLYTLHSIVQCKTASPLKIRLAAKQWFN
jgi:hypothetical protein